MKAPTDTIRLNGRAREQLTRLKRFTGIEHWNILARWAFCLSLRDNSLPAAIAQDKSSGVEITWRVFAGDQASVYASLFWHWNAQASLKEQDIQDLISRHIQRGLGIMESHHLEHAEDLFCVT
jgi:DNA sulfur modification protein DndE